MAKKKDEEDKDPTKQATIRRYRLQLKKPWHAYLLDLMSQHTRYLRNLCLQWKYDLRNRTSGFQPHVGIGYFKEQSGRFEHPASPYDEQRRVAAQAQAYAVSVRVSRGLPPHPEPSCRFCLFHQLLSCTEGLEYEKDCPGFLLQPDLDKRCKKVCASCVNCVRGCHEGTELCKNYVEWLPVGALYALIGEIPAMKEAYPSLKYIHGSLCQKAMKQVDKEWNSHLALLAKWSAHRAVCTNKGSTHKLGKQRVKCRECIRPNKPRANREMVYARESIMAKVPDPVTITSHIDADYVLGRLDWAAACKTSDIIDGNTRIGAYDYTMNLLCAATESVHVSTSILLTAFIDVKGAGTYTAYIEGGRVTLVRGIIGKGHKVSIDVSTDVDTVRSLTSGEVSVHEAAKRVSITYREIIERTAIVVVEKGSRGFLITPFDTDVSPLEKVRDATKRKKKHEPEKPIEHKRLPAVVMWIVPASACAHVPHMVKRYPSKKLGKLGKKRKNALIWCETSAEQVRRADRNRFYTLTFDGSGIRRLSDHKLRIPTGRTYCSIVVRTIRKLPETFKEVKIVECDGKYEALLTIENELPEMVAKDSPRVLSIDAGIRKLFVGYNHDGKVVRARNRMLQKGDRKEIDNIVSMRSKCIKGSRRYMYLTRRKNKLEKMWKDRKRTAIDQAVSYVIKNLDYDILLLGDLDIQQMIDKKTTKWKAECKVAKKNGEPRPRKPKDLRYALARQACWGILKRQAISHNLLVGRRVIIKSEAYTSQECVVCGNMFRTREETYICPKCGLTVDRDILGAVNFMRKYYPESAPSPEEFVFRFHGRGFDSQGRLIIRKQFWRTHIVNPKTGKEYIASSAVVEAYRPCVVCPIHEPITDKGNKRWDKNYRSVAWFERRPATLGYVNPRDPQIEDQINTAYMEVLMPVPSQDKKRRVPDSMKKRVIVEILPECSVAPECGV